MGRTVFTSQVSFEDAAQQAVNAGFQPVGTARNKNGNYVVFAQNIQQDQSPNMRRQQRAPRAQKQAPQQQQQRRHPLDASWLRGKI